MTLTLIGDTYILARWLYNCNRCAVIYASKPKAAEKNLGTPRLIAQPTFKARTRRQNQRFDDTDNMAPSYDNLPVDDDFDENEIDFSDLQEQYEVRLDEGLDSFVVIDGLPKVPEESRQKLVKFLLRKLNDAGKAKEDGIYMPLNEETGQTEG